MPVGFVRDEARRQEALRLHDALSAAEPAGARHHVVAQLVAVADQRQMHAEIFERVVARVAHQLLDRVGAVRLGTAAHRGLVDFEEHPIFAVRPNAGKGGERQRRRVAGRAAVGQHGRQRLDDEIDDALDLAETRFRRDGGDRVVDRAERRRHFHRPKRALVLRDVLVVRIGVEQQRAEGEIAGDLGRALERHVESGRRPAAPSR